MNKNFSRRLLCVGVAGAIALLAGCAAPGGSSGSSSASATTSGAVASQINQSNVARVGFLTDYSRLTPMPGGSGMLCWRASDVNWKQYDKVLFERIQVYIKPGSEKPVDPTDLKNLIDYFHSSLVKATTPVARVVSATGPGVVRVQIALTALIPTDTTDSLLGTAVPYGFVAEIGAGEAAGRPAGSTPYMGQTGMEVRARDGVSGRILAECADNEIGLKYAADMNAGAAGAAQKWIGGYMDSFSAWNYAKAAFDKWSALFAQRFTALRS